MSTVCAGEPAHPPALDDPFDAGAAQAAAVLADRTGAERHDVALVLGSGWAPAADLLGETLAEVAADEVPGFHKPAVERPRRHAAVGADRRDRLARTGSRRPHPPLRGTRRRARSSTASARRPPPGCHTSSSPTAAAALRPEWGPGTPVLISDHLNLTATSPLEGATFVDLTDLYSARLRAVAREVDADARRGRLRPVPRPALRDAGRGAGWPRSIGADLVGMSTTLEAIAARQAGMEVLGISLVTNLAAGISAEPLDHAEVLEAGRAAGPRASARCWPR